MIDALRKLLTSFDEDIVGDDSAHEHALRLATGVLLVEVARADTEYSDEEQDEVVELLAAHLELERDEAEDLARLAHEEAEAAVSLQGFTRKLHERLDEADKRRIVELLWRVAYADGVLDRHEDHLVRRIADLLYVRHPEMIGIRNRVREELGL